MTTPQCKCQKLLDSCYFEPKEIILALKAAKPGGGFGFTRGWIQVAPVAPR